MLTPLLSPLLSNDTDDATENRYLIPEALEQGCDTLISIGGVQSNHTRQVAGVAAKLGLKVCYTSIQSPMGNWTLIRGATDAEICRLNSSKSTGLTGPILATRKSATFNFLV